MVHNVFVWQKEKTISVRQMAMPMNISAISPPTPFMNHNGGTHLSFNTTAASQQSAAQIMQPQMTNHNGGIGANSTMNHSTHHLGVRTTPVTQLTPMSGNHSHISFNHSTYLPYGIRTATATPPTPKVGVNGGGGGAPPPLPNRDASGSVSPGMGQGDLNVTTNSPLELSTLV